MHNLFKFKKKPPEVPVAPPVVVDAAPALKPLTNEVPISKIAPMTPVTMSFAQAYSGGRGRFIPPEYDLTEVGIIEDTDAYVRQSFKKKTGLMFKEGLSYRGANKETLQYIKKRMSQIEQASNIPSESLLKSVGRSLIRVSNAFLIKVRKKEASGGGVRKLPNGKKIDPVAAYFPAAPETMYVDLDADTGKIVRWRQELPDGKYKTFPAEDVVHFTTDRREGFIFGIPTIIPVIDDIRALRQIEENIELLLYHHLFPLFQYIVGTKEAPAGIDEEGNREIDVVKQKIKLMPLEGGIVTSERHEIKAIGAEGRAVRAEGYLDHFTKRVIAGLGISSIDLGDGETSNKATANTLSRALIDTVKDVQDELESQWNHLIIKELLLESTFGEDVLEQENMVYLQFNEIDIVNKMELEKHSTALFESNGITYSEYRVSLGREPIEIPEDPQDQDVTKYPEWMQTNWKLFKEPENIIRSIDEPWTPFAKQASENRSLGTTDPQLESSKKEMEEKEKALIKTKEAAKPKPKARDNFVSRAFTLLENETTEHAASNLTTRGSIDYPFLRAHARAWKGLVGKDLKRDAYLSLLRSFNDSTGGLSYRYNTQLAVARADVERRIDFYLDKLTTDTLALLRRRIDALSRGAKLTRGQQLEQIHVAFESTHYRTNFIEDVEIRKAANYGKMLAETYHHKKAVNIVPGVDCCSRCRTRASETGVVAFIPLDDMVPYHASCTCSITSGKGN